MLLVCGEALWYLFSAEAEGELTFKARIGGSPFNVAVGLARLGHRAFRVTELEDQGLAGLMHRVKRGRGENAQDDQADGDDKDQSATHGSCSPAYWLWPAGAPPLDRRCNSLSGR